MKIKVNNKKILTVMFVLFFVTELFFSYTILSRFMLILFCGLSCIWCRKLYINPFCISYTFFCIWSLINIFFGHVIDRHIAMDMTMTLILNCMFLYGFTQYCGLIKEPIVVLKTYKNICVFASCFFCVFGMSSIFSGERLSVLGINANAIGTFAAYSLIIHIYQLYENRRFNFRDVLIFILFITVILFSGSRKGVLIPIFGWYVMLCLQKPKKILKYSVIIIGFVILVVMLVLNIDFLYNIIGYRIEPLLLFLKGMNYEEDSLMTRNHFIQYAWESSQESMIWGHGLDCFRTLPRAYDTYSHCNYLEILFSTGIVGVLIYYSTSVIALIKAKKTLRHNNKDVVLMLVLLIPFLICDFLNVTYFTRRMIIIPSITIMFLRRYRNEYNK